VISRNLVLRLRGRLSPVVAALALALISAIPASANGIGSAYVANSGAKQLTIIDVESLAAVDVVPTKGQPAGLAIDSAGKFIYVAQKDTNDLLIISRDDYSPVATVPVGTAPVGVSLSKDGKQAFVINSGSNNVTVVDTAAKSVVKTLPAGSQPSAAALLPDGNTLLVSNTEMALPSLSAT
jgi:YVTN family beta-propeller protein